MRVDRVRLVAPFLVSWTATALHCRLLRCVSGRVLEFDACIKLRHRGIERHDLHVRSACCPRQPTNNSTSHLLLV